MFDFTRSRIGQMPEEDVYSANPESLWGITPGMRADINRRDVLEGVRKQQFGNAVTSGANPIQLALLDPQLYYERTGQAVGFDAEGQPYSWRPGFETAESLGSQKRALLEGRKLDIEQQKERDFLQSDVLRSQRQQINSPVAQAMNRLSPEVADAIAKIQGGYTGVYGDPSQGVPSTYEQKRTIQEIETSPFLAESKRREREFEEGAPRRAAETESIRKAPELKERELKVESIASGLKALGTALQTTYDLDSRAEILNKMDALQGQLNGLMGINYGPAKGGEGGISPDVLKDIRSRYNPRKYKGKRMIFRDPATQARVVLESTGSEWIVPQGTQIEESPPQRNPRGGT